MLKVAITGNIASGKSTVENYLKNKGYMVFDTDLMTHEILKRKKLEIISAFLPYDVLEKGEISRLKLSKIIFSNPVVKRKLENIVHPVIRSKINAIYRKFSKEQMIFISVPLLYESNMQDLFDKVLLMYIDEEIQLERLMKRSGLSEEEALLRINSQMPQKEKVKKTDYIIYNNKSVSDTLAAVDTFLENLNPKRS